MSTARVSVSAQEMSNLYLEIYCSIAIFAFLVYDWLLCLGQEVEFIWNWHSRRVTIASLVYALSRYTWLVEILLTVMTVNPMSDLSCKANVWTQVVMATLGIVASSAFSALRAYALSNRRMWLVTTIILLALPLVVIKIVAQLYLAPMNQPSPFNCSASSSLPPTLSVSAPLVARASQVLAELLVIGITWWYTYQSYRIQRGITLGKTISSVLFYNGSIYFLCLVTLYILDIILNTSSLPVEVQQGVSIFNTFIDPISSILTCRFMLSLRHFDSAIMSVTSSRLGPQLRDHVASTVLRFAAQPSDSLPALISSFAHPVHINTSLFEMDPDAQIVDNGCEGREIDDNVLVSSRDEEASRHSATRTAEGQMTKLPDSSV